MVEFEVDFMVVINVMVKDFEKKLGEHLDDL
jgi:hypothetical protein